MRHPIAVERAKAMRRRLSPFEAKLWRHLKQRQVAGTKFRRQAPVGPYIADFLSHDAMLVVEIDGETHLGRERHDERRTLFLQGQGFRVIRFTNVDVRNNLEQVLIQIDEACRG